MKACMGRGQDTRCDRVKNIGPRRCNKAALAETNLIGLPECDRRFSPVKFEAPQPPRPPSPHPRAHILTEPFFRPWTQRILQITVPFTAIRNVQALCCSQTLFESLNLPPFTQRFGGKRLPERQVVLPDGHKEGERATPCCSGTGIEWAEYLRQLKIAR